VTVGSSGSVIFGVENIGGLGAMLESFPVIKRVAVYGRRFVFER
jgi:hypothetical protein